MSPKFVLLTLLLVTFIIIAAQLYLMNIQIEGVGLRIGILEETIGSKDFNVTP